MKFLTFIDANVHGLSDNISPLPIAADRVHEESLQSNVINQSVALVDSRLIRDALNDAITLRRVWLVLRLLLRVFREPSDARFIEQQINDPRKTNAALDGHLDEEFKALNFIKI